MRPRLASAWSSSASRPSLARVHGAVRWMYRLAAATSSHAASAPRRRSSRSIASTYAAHHAEPLGVQRGGVAGRDRAAAVLHDHRERARDQVAEPVGQIGGVALVEPLPGEVAVRLESHFAEQEVAEGVGAVAVDGRVEAHRATLRLGDLGAAPLDVAVRPDLPLHRESGTRAASPARARSEAGRCLCRSRAGRRATAARSRDRESPSPRDS